MKFGLIAPYQQGRIEDGSYTMAFAKLAEETGFESLWAVEHVVMCPEYTSRYPYDPSGRSPFEADVVQPDPLTWLAWAGAATENIKLGTAVLILPLHNPLVLAKTAASLDRLSAGRLLLGIGVGWVEEEAQAVGTDFKTRGARCDESIAAMRALWSGGVSSYSGQHIQFEKVVSQPSPSAPTGVPILVGGHSKAAAQRAGRLGNGFLPLGVFGPELDQLLLTMGEAASEANRDPAEIEVTTMGAPDLGFVEGLAAQGVGRVIFSPSTGDLEEMRVSLETIRTNVIEKFQS